MDVDCTIIIVNRWFSGVKCVTNVVICVLTYGNLRYYYFCLDCNCYLLANNFNIVEIQMCVLNLMGSVDVISDISVTHVPGFTLFTPLKLKQLKIIHF